MCECMKIYENHFLNFDVTKKFSQCFLNAIPKKGNLLQGNFGA